MSKERHIKEKLIDLEPKQLQLLKTIITRHIPNKTVWAYGSRVTWKASETSDLDLVVFGSHSGKIFDLKESFVESSLLISVDVMDWESIPDSFKENIRKKYVVIQQSSVPEGWREVKFENIAHLVKNTWRVGDEKLPYVGLEHIDKNRLRLNSVGNSDSISSNKFRFAVGDTLFGRLNPYFRKVIKPKFEGICSTDIWVVRPKENVNKDYLFYFFANQELVDIASSSSMGTSLPRADWDFLSETTWKLPPPPEQKAIAEVLSSLDDKIDLLHRQNTTLENMAQTLFRKWFVEDADEGWKDVELGETVNIAIGRTPPRKEHEWFSKKPGDWKWVSIKDMGKCGVYIFDTAEYLTQAAVEKYNIPVIPNKTVILSFKMTLGRVGITTEDMLSNEAIAHFKFRPGTPYSREYLYFFLKLFKFASLGSTSSIVTSINTEMIRSFKIPIPDAESMSKFEGIGKLLFEGIHSNQSQIRTLENLRNLLLPKLMSGKARI